MNRRELARFFSKVVVVNGCWQWTATRLAKGYGRFTVGGLQRVAHRVAYAAFGGPVPDGCRRASDRKWRLKTQITLAKVG